MTNTRQLMPHLHYLRLSVGQAYVWIEDEGAILIDTGGPGCLPEIQAALGGLGLGADDLRYVVLTHGHGSNAGAAGEVARWARGAEVIAHRFDARVIRGEVPAPRPRVEGTGTWLSAELIAALSSFPSAPVHAEVEDRDVLGFAGGAVIRHVPGHTGGSIAVELPEHRVVFTGGAAIRTDRSITVGQANLDDDSALLSFARIALLRPDVACFGFGPPLVGNAADELLTAFRALDDTRGDPGPGTRLCAW